INEAPSNRQNLGVQERPIQSRRPCKAPRQLKHRPPSDAQVPPLWLDAIGRLDRVTPLRNVPRGLEDILPERPPPVETDPQSEFGWRVVRSHGAVAALKVRHEAV